MTANFSEMDFNSMVESLYDSDSEPASIIGDRHAHGEAQLIDSPKYMTRAECMCLPEDVASLKSPLQTTEVAVEADIATIDTAVVDKWECAVCETENFDFDGSTCSKCGFNMDVEEPVRDSDNARKSSGYFGSKQAYKQRPMDAHSILSSKMAAASKCIAAEVAEVATESVNHFSSKQAMFEAACAAANTVEDSEAVIPVVGSTVTSPVTTVDATLVESTVVKLTKVAKKPRRKPSKKRKRNASAPKVAKVFQQKTGKWLVRMDYNGQKQKYIGRFQHEAEARAAAALCEADPTAFFEGKKSSAAAKKKPRVE